MMVKIPRKWRKKREDHNAGLVFDRRGTGFFSWRVVLFFIPFALLLIVGMNCVEVSVLDSNLRKSHYSGMVFFLESDSSGKTIPGRNNASPILDRTPVWADPAYLGNSGGAFVPLTAGLGDHEAHLVDVDMGTPSKLQTSLLSQLSYPSPSVEKWLVPSADRPVVFIPEASSPDDDLSGMEPVADVKPTMGRNFMGLQTSFWVVVSPWGVPTHVVVTEGSGNEAADEAAMGYIRELRWIPSRKDRSGMIMVTWKEEEEEGI